jgi:hypothetical protein
MGDPFAAFRNPLDKQKRGEYIPKLEYKGGF